MIADWQQSGKSKKAHCVENGINASKFYYWISRIKESDTSAVGFLAIDKGIKHGAKDKSGVAIADLPERVIDRGIPGASLLAMILTAKYMDHLPLYRQKQIFARENIQIPSSTIEIFSNLKDL